MVYVLQIEVKNFSSPQSAEMFPIEHLPIGDGPQASLKGPQKPADAAIRRDCRSTSDRLAIGLAPQLSQKSQGSPSQNCYHPSRSLILRSARLSATRMAAKYSPRRSARPATARPGPAPSSIGRQAARPDRLHTTRSIQCLSVIGISHTPRFPSLPPNSRNTRFWASGKFPET